MLSSPSPSNTSTSTLHSGTLTLHLDRPTYERAGLSGRPIRSPARPHQTSRYAITLDLRAPSMVRGRKAFARMQRAFENVLSETITWLFCDLQPASAPGDGVPPIDAHHPVHHFVAPSVEVAERVRVPRFPREMADGDRETTGEMLEWLTLAMMPSPRLKDGDRMDPYLSQYAVPELVGGATEEVRDLTKFSWRGLVPVQFAQRMVLAALKASGEEWVAVNTSTFDGKSLMVLFQKEQSMMWEFYE